MSVPVYRPLMKWVKGLLGLGLVAALLAIGVRSYVGPPPTAKNVILLISDGCGYRHLEAANLYQHGRRHAQAYEQWRVRYGMTTFPMLRDKERSTWYEAGYDPANVRRHCTESAAAATAMSTGQKTYCGAIGVDVAKCPLPHVLEEAEALGKATGVVSTVPFSHATPAAFVAHDTKRGHYAEIAREMIFDSAVDVVMGCGHPLFDGDGRPLDTPTTYAYVGGKASWDALAHADGALGADANGDGAPDRWRLLQRRREFQALAEGPAPARVIGIPQVATTLQQGRASSGDDSPYADPLVATVPTLAELTRAALNVLDGDPDGLFLVIEGGAVDWAAHGNRSGRMIEEEIDFNAAVDAVIEWVEQHGGWDETLVIVTGDHETGDLARSARDGDDRELENRGKGRLPGMVWRSKRHTNSLIPLFARGVGSWRFQLHVEGYDARVGDYVDNTSIAEVIRAALR